MAPRWARRPHRRGQGWDRARIRCGGRKFGATGDGLPYLCHRVGTTRTTGSPTPRSGRNKRGSVPCAPDASGVGSASPRVAATLGLQSEIESNRNAVLSCRSVSRAICADKAITALRLEQWTPNNPGLRQPRAGSRSPLRVGRNSAALGGTRSPSALAMDLAARGRGLHRFLPTRNGAFHQNFIYRSAIGAARHSSGMPKELTSATAMGRRSAQSWSTSRPIALLLRGCR